MATTITLGSSINYAQTYLGFRPLNIGVNNEPAVTWANIVLQTILGPPLAWNWNRNSTSFATVQGTQDYPEAVSDFGFIERADYGIAAATITNTALSNGVATYTCSNTFQQGDVVTVTGTTNGSGVFNVTNVVIQSASSSQFTINLANSNVSGSADTGTAVVGKQTEISQLVNILGTGTNQGTPANIAPQKDDNAGNITFRLLPIPNRAYNVNVIYQKRIPALITGLSSTWAPVPDHYSVIYQDGFLAGMLAFAGDPRAVQVSQRFVGRLLSFQEGLNETQRNQFMQTWFMQMNLFQANQQWTSQGASGRQTP